MEAIYNIPAAVSNAWNKVPISRETPQNILNFAKHYFQNVTIASIKESKWTYVLGGFLIAGLIYKIHTYVVAKTTITLTTEKADLQSKLKAEKLTVKMKEEEIAQLNLQLVEEAAGRSGDLVFAAQKTKAALDCYVQALKNKHNIDFSVVANQAQTIEGLRQDLAKFQQEKCALSKRLENLVDRLFPNPLDGSLNGSFARPEVREQVAQAFLSSPLNQPPVENGSALDVSMRVKALDLAELRTPRKQNFTPAASLEEIKKPPMNPNLLEQIQQFTEKKKLKPLGEPSTPPNTPAVGGIREALLNNRQFIQDTPEKQPDNLNDSWANTSVNDGNAAKPNTAPEAAPACNLDTPSVKNNDQDNG